MTKSMVSKITKVLVLSSAIILLAAGCNNSNERPAENVTAGPNVQTPQSQLGIQPGGQPVQQPASEPKKQSGEPIMVDVTQIVQGAGSSLVSYNIAENTSALALLKMSNKVETKNFSGVGEFVESINGIKADTKHFWELLVNGKSSSVGAGSYQLKAGDKVEWKLTEIK